MSHLWDSDEARRVFLSNITGRCTDFEILTHSRVLISRARISQPCEEIQGLIGLPHVHEGPSIQQHQLVKEVEDLGLGLVDGVDNGTGGCKSPQLGAEAERRDAVKSAGWFIQEQQGRAHDKLHSDT